MVAVHVLAIWCAYSLVQRWSLEHGRFSAMMLLSQLRPEGNPLQNFKIILSKMRKVNAIPSGWVPIKLLDGDNDGCKKGGRSIVYYRAGNEIACQLEEDFSCYKLFSPYLSNTKTLKELLANHPSNQVRVYEDIPTRLNWMKAIQACAAPNAKTLNGEYFYCFRDYVNYEELINMLARRKTWESLLIQPRNGVLTIFDCDNPRQKRCTLKERGSLFLLLPISIEWSGHFYPFNHTIHWMASSINIGWKRMGKTLVKPKASEMKRQEPWVVFHPRRDSSGGILILHRIGYGKLVYAKKDYLDK